MPHSMRPMERNRDVYGAPGRAKGCKSERAKGSSDGGSPGQARRWQEERSHATRDAASIVTFIGRWIQGKTCEIVVINDCLLKNERLPFRGNLLRLL